MALTVSKSIVIAGAARTPIGKFGGSMKSLQASDLGVVAAKGVLEKSGVPSDAVDEVIFGNGRQAGVRPNVARQVAYRAGLGEGTPAYTINKACGSSLKAVINAYGAVALGDAEVVLAGGTESMSNTPYMLLDARWGHKLGHSEITDGMYRDGFLCPLCEELMGETAEKLVDKYGITREETDRYAMETQRRCQAAREAGRFAEDRSHRSAWAKRCGPSPRSRRASKGRRDDGEPRKSEAGFPEGWNGACR